MLSKITSFLVSSSKMIEASFYIMLIICTYLFLFFHPIVSSEILADSFLKGLSEFSIGKDRLVKNVLRRRSYRSFMWGFQISNSFVVNEVKLVLYLICFLLDLGNQHLGIQSQFSIVFCFVGLVSFSLKNFTSLLLHFAQLFFDK